MSPSAELHCLEARSTPAAFLTHYPGLGSPSTPQAGLGLTHLPAGPPRPSAARTLRPGLPSHLLAMREPCHQRLAQGLPGPAAILAWSEGQRGSGRAVTTAGLGLTEQDPVLAVGRRCSTLPVACWLLSFTARSYLPGRPAQPNITANGGRLCDPASMSSHASKARRNRLLL